MMDYSDKIKQRVVDAHLTLIQTMDLMNQMRMKSFLVFKDSVFLGIITNGDLQRAIIAKTPFDTPIERIVDNSTKVYAKENEDLSIIKAWMLHNRAEIMPIISTEGLLSDVVFWEDIVKTHEIEQVVSKNLQLPVVIMAGGKGVRLKPLTNVIPKPMIPIGNKTIIEEIMDRFERVGCHKFYLSVNYKSELLRYYLSQLDHKYDIVYFEENRPLGTIGSVSLLKDKVTTPFFVSNCDILVNQDMGDVYEYHTNNENDITVITAVKSISIPYGVVETGENGLMTTIKEKPELTYMVNTGVYLLNPDCILEIPEEEFFNITQLMERIKERGGRVGCFPISEHAWKDMGEWGDYLKMINTL